MSRKAQVIICGAGIAGVSAAYHLARAGFKDILIVDPLPPLSLTSDRSTECYRNWWPDAEMTALMNRSIDILERLRLESGNVFRMNRRGYVYFTADESGLDEFQRQAARIASLGAGSLRIHSTADCSYQPAEPSAPSASSPARDHAAADPTGSPPMLSLSSPPDALSLPPSPPSIPSVPPPAPPVHSIHSINGYANGADLLLGPDLVHRYFPYITNSAIAALHVRRAGWLSAQQLGMYLLEQARLLGVRIERASIERIDLAGGRVQSAYLSTGEHIHCDNFVIAAGPYTKRIGSLLGLDLPLATELHLKVTFKDALGVVPRDTSLLIWYNPQFLPWEPDEREALSEDPSTRWLTEEFPAGAHLRPEGTRDSQTIMLLWDYKPRWMNPTFPPPLDDLYPEITLRGMATMIPGLRRYLGRAPKPYLDGGYYVKTPENRLLAGPLPVEGAFMIGGLSGFGIMSSCAAGELLAAHMAGLELPRYAPAFALERYANAEYQARLANWDDIGQL